MSKKRIGAKLYMESKFKWVKHELAVERDPDGFLFSDDRYRTKILPEDLPEWFVYGYLSKRHGYISAEGVKHLLYVPNYTFDNHLHKYDSLLISYEAEIVPYENEGGFSWYKGYDYSVDGRIILSFIEAAEKYSGYDVGEIREELARKRAWFEAKNP